MSPRLPPECLLCIFENFGPRNNDWTDSFKSLYACILVNRKWCEVGLTILWREPIEWLHSKERNRSRLVSLMTVYISCLPDDSKLQILNSALQLPDSTLKSASIDYSSLMKGFDYQSLYNAIGFWLSKNYNQQKNMATNEIKFHQLQFMNLVCKLFMNKCKNLRRFSIFMKAGIKDEILHLPLLLGAEECLSNITEFSCKGCLSSEFMYLASQSCRNIKRFNIECCCTDNGGLIRLIEVQKVPLDCILINMKNNNIPLLEDVIRKRSHSVTEIRLFGLDYSLDFFKESKNLEKIKVFPTMHIDESIWENFIHCSFPKLRELRIRPKYCSLLQLGALIKNTHGSLEYLEINFADSINVEEFPAFTEILINNCKNLYYYNGPFHIEGFEMLQSFFQKCPKLEYLIIRNSKSDVEYVKNGVDISNLLQQSGSFIPINLTKFQIIGNFIISVEALKIFLQECSIRLLKVLEFKFTPQSLDIELVMENFANQNVIKSNYNKYELCENPLEFIQE
ncbi:unnamed protein product [Rhizophagus irregularis]|nr:hypothetical protein RirG_036990 [Rhizophagus irregularis DAOM 197198w]CAB4495078.1 unnamed protein product [Rhizophagus irregularis]GBC23428.2 hypothetical protein GLOIN_2v1875424 [Rhizophagus irregularis DAOM 181602=DAOM 197198]CAB5190241.1 unnamed protein product [Rhizophagus irregularis]CAB5394517.1 unnamed protein product [Rhizophagus irregularis]